MVRTVLMLLMIAVHFVQAQHSLNGFTQWRTGHDDETRQIEPREGNDGLVKKKGLVYAHAVFVVRGYGELSFPIDPSTLDGEEAKRVDLSKSKFIRVTYKATQNAILQLRQTGVHGGIHNKILLSASKPFTTRIIYFSEFTDGKTPLDLSDVAKFNFAFLGRKDEKPYKAELIVRAFEIDNYKPDDNR